MPDLLTSYKININGKSVEFILQKEFTPRLPRLFPEQITQFRKIVSKDKDFLNLFNDYINKDEIGYFKRFRKLIELRFIELLKVHPEFITSNNFKIYLTYTLSPLAGGATYDSTKSTENYVYIVLHLDYVIREILSGGPNRIFEMIYHELTHHLDRKYISRIAELRRNVKRLKPKSRLPRNFDYILRCFSDLRIEGLPVFAANFKIQHKINLDFSDFKKLIEYLENLCNNFDSGYLKRLEISRYYEDVERSVGSSMTAIIVLYELFKRNVTSSVWIKRKVVLFSREYNADKIGKFFGSKNFLLIFPDEGVYGLIDQILNYLSMIGHLRFLILYQEACKYFSIKETFLDSKSYHYYSTLCIYNFKRTVLSIDDPKIKRQLERFKR